uniref:uncharacterized protein LOC120346032 n=1 Tax=Styela clava TaxID=7725 RepID=UPI001939C873|nr:uncharacterized protein LOC120346032 [Styela clava]
MFYKSVMAAAVYGKQGSSPIRPNSSQSRKRSPYRTRSHSSEVDETLFGRPARYHDQKDTPRINPEDVTWDPPWITSPKKTGVPLLWSPFDSKDAEDMNSTRKSVKTTTPRTPKSAKQKYRVRKLVPSYVDETLFATPRKTSDLRAPWATDDMSPDASAPAQIICPPSVDAANPLTPIQVSRVESKTAVGENTMHYTPVIKARPGSAINTPQSRIKPDVRRKKSNSQTEPQKLDFCLENGLKKHAEDEDPNEIVQRALKLAGINRNNESPRYRSNSLDGLSSRASTPGRYFWRRPASSASSTADISTNMRDRTSSRSMNKKQSKTELEIDDLFSATGKHMPLSARNSPRRPNSARTENSPGSVPGLDLSRPPRLYKSEKPLRSARSAASMSSTLSNRPSWRP